MYLECVCMYACMDIYIYIERDIYASTYMSVTTVN